MADAQKGRRAHPDTLAFFHQNGPPEVQCEQFFPDFWVEFWMVNFER